MDMITKLNIFRTLSVAFIAVVCSNAYSIPKDSSRMELRRELMDAKYEKHKEKVADIWMKLIPRHSTFQFAGGMGLIELSIGWDYGKKRQWNTDLFFGFIPKYSSKDYKLVISLKETYYPWNLTLSRHLSVQPLSASIYFSSVAADNFWARQPSKYPNGYYWFSTRIRTNIAIGSAFLINHDRKSYDRNIALFYELGTNDFYILSMFGNDYIKLTDIFKLSLGLKVQFR